MMNKTWRLDEKPLLVFWETTKACNLACKHCRAEAIPEALPDELSYDEGIELINQIVAFGKHPPVLILTGGDVLMRKRLFDLIAYAGKRMIFTFPSPQASQIF